MLTSGLHTHEQCACVSMFAWVRTRTHVHEHVRAHAYRGMGTPKNFNLKVCGLRFVWHHVLRPLRLKTLKQVNPEVLLCSLTS